MVLHEKKAPAEQVFSYGLNIRTEGGFCLRKGEMGEVRIYLYIKCELTECAKKDSKCLTQKDIRI